MNLEKLKIRKADLMREESVAINNVAALQGAIQDCDFWIDALTKEAAALAATAPKVKKEKKVKAGKVTPNEEPQS